MSNPMLRLQIDYVQVRRDWIDELDIFELGIVVNALHLLTVCEEVSFQDLCLAVSLKVGIQVTDIREVLVKAFEIRAEPQLVLFSKPPKVKQKKAAANNLQHKPTKQIALPKVNAAWMHDAKGRFPTVDVITEYTKMLNWYSAKMNKVPTVDQAESWMQKVHLSRPTKEGAPPTCLACKGVGRVQKEVRGVMEYVPCSICQIR